MTVTSDRPPLTVGLSDACLNEWEDLCDLDGNPTGVEVMELNIRPQHGGQVINNRRVGSYTDDIECVNEGNDGFDHMLLMMGRDMRVYDEGRRQVIHWVAGIIVEMVVAWFLCSMAESERMCRSSEWEALNYTDQIGKRGKSGAEQGGGTCSAELSGTETSSGDNWEQSIDVVSDSLVGRGMAQAHSDEESWYQADIDSNSDIE